MTTFKISRRFFLAAPAIVCAANLMPVRALRLFDPDQQMTAGRLSDVDIEGILDYWRVWFRDAYRVPRKLEILWGAAVPVRTAACGFDGIAGEHVLNTGQYNDV